jgi:hypothetical protein
MFTNDITLFRNYFPFPGRQSVDVCNPVIANNFRTPNFGADRHSMSHSARICVSVTGGIGSHQNTVCVQERVYLYDFFRSQQMTLRADLIQNTLHIMNPIDLILVDCQTYCTAAVPAGGLSCFFFQGFV